MSYTPKKKTISGYEQALSDWQTLAVKLVEKHGRCNKVYIDDRIPLDTSYKMASLVGLCRSKAEIEATFSEFDHAELKDLLEVRDNVDPARMAIEKKFAPAMQEWLQEQVQRIINGLDIESNPPGGGFWRDETVLLTAFLIPHVGEWMEASIAQQATLLQGIGVGIDANINARAAEWAGKYGLDLAKGLNGTTKELAKAKIRNWAVSGRSMPELVDDLSVVISPKWRAELIASTEVTHAYSQAVEGVLSESNVAKAVVWQTAMDERVCPVCGSLHGTRKKQGGVFPSGYSRPPAHPRCRCWLTLDV